MSRDERRTRARGLPPSLTLVRDIRALMPTDPEAGGTWVSVNQHGLTMALLNRYEESPRDPGGAFTSRGLLIREMGWMEGLEGVEGELRSRPLLRFRPFTLAGLARGGTPHLFDWDGHQLIRTVLSDPGLVRASSGSHQLDAERARGALFRAAAGEPGGLTAATLERLHRSHQPVRGPISICMHREEAMTVSLSLITVIEKKISIFYVDGSPGETAGGLLQSL
jgi:hypothetical protein